MEKKKKTGIFTVTIGTGRMDLQIMQKGHKYISRINQNRTEGGPADDRGLRCYRSELY